MRIFFLFSKAFFYIVWMTRGVLTVLLLLILGGGSIIYAIEPLSYWQSIYLSFVTALTIGYGDLTPLTPLAQITALVIGYIGMVFMGLTVAIASLSLKKAVESS